ncbi:hypothetical protein CUMW_266090 [Citrus unshiu]|nr:hypothetical protein CUMW_266090 [Citrus unshiu]
MEASKKQAIKLREQVAKQQQAVLKHLLHLGIENVALKLSVTNNFKIYTIPPGQLRNHPPLANNKTLFDIDLLWLLTEVASIYQTELNHFQRNVVRGVEVFVAVSLKQMEIARKLAEDCCQYGAENQVTSLCVAKLLFQFGLFDI